MKLDSVARASVYCLFFCLGLVIIIGGAVMRGPGGTCPLFDKRANGPLFACSFSLVIAVIFQMIYAPFRVILLVLLIVNKLTPDQCCFSDFMTSVFFVVDIMALILTTIGACILSAGHAYTCDERYCHKDLVRWIAPSEAAQIGAWVSSVLWLVVVLVNYIVLRRAGKLPWSRSGRQTRTNESISGAASPSGMSLTNQY